MPANDRGRTPGRTGACLGVLALLEIGTRQVERNHIGRLVHSPDCRDNLRQHETAIFRAARTSSRQRIVWQCLNAQTNEIVQSVGEGQGIDVRGHLFPTGEHGVILLHLEFAAARRRSRGGRQRRPAAFLCHGVGLIFLPCGVSSQPFGARRIVIFLRPRQGIHQPLYLERLLLVRQQHSRLAAPNARLFDVGEERAESIKITLLNGIKFMVVTLGATNGLAQPHAAHGADTVRQHAGFVVLGLGAAFFRREDEAIESGGDFLFGRAIGQQVAGQLLARELVEGLILIEGFDDVIAIRPYVPGIVGMVANRIGIAHDVEPANRHALAKLRRSEKLLYEPGHRFRRFVLHESLHFPGLGRQTNQVKAQPARERAAVGPR